MNYRQNMANCCPPVSRPIPAPAPPVCENICAYPIAMAYVPIQTFQTTYELNKALEVGTIFPELHKPFCGKRCVR
ncbi:MAG: spore coat associated protein CotJA [Clostridia bacterium]|nr:spore coat associated protein CotJA [Lachnospiraceae bacterium]NCB99427.1 spore coat associated protein CotJA [Clostridia bacterium]NCD01470.1 spore coat associated protein CotJA [Clostridia bacterium]